MARALTPRERNLALVLILLGVVAMWSVFRPDEEARQAAQAKREAQRRREPGAEDAPRVRMDLLARSSEDVAESARDLFKYAPRPPSRAEVARLKREAEEARRQAEIERKRQEEMAKIAAIQAQKEAEARALLPPPPPPPPTPPSINFQYLGYLGPKDGKIAVFMDGQDMVLARVGEVLKREFKVVDIKYDTVVMGYVKKEFQSQTRELPITRR